MTALPYPTAFPLVATSAAWNAAAFQRRRAQALRTLRHARATLNAPSCNSDDREYWITAMPRERQFLANLRAARGLVALVAL